MDVGAGFRWVVLRRWVEPMVFKEVVRGKGCLKEVYGAKGCL